MIIPYSIPNWLKVRKQAKQYGLDIHINIDPFKSKQSGHMFYFGRSYAFEIQVFPKNLVVSMKEYNNEIYQIWEKAMEQNYQIAYQAQTPFPFHGEWYFECTEEEKERELARMQRSINIKILDIRY